MSLLELEHVAKRYREERRERVVLADVSLHVEVGECVFLHGPRRSGRTTLLRVAAGIEAPDAGRVRFQGRALDGARGSMLGAGIGYVRKMLAAGEEDGVLEQVAAPLFARGVTGARALDAARAALARAGGERCAQAAVGELSVGERVRVALARALVLSPALLLVDEPAAAVELSERDGVLAQLRVLSREGTAVLACTGEPSELAGVDRALMLGDGRLRGPAAPARGQVVALRRGA